MQKEINETSNLCSRRPLVIGLNYIISSLRLGTSVLECCLGEVGKGCFFDRNGLNFAGS